MTGTSLRDVAGNLRRTPPLLILQKVLRHVPFRPVNFATLCFLKFDGVPRVPPALQRGRCTVRWATRNDLDDLARLQGKAGEFEKRFANGDRCAVAVVNDRIAGFEWFCDQAVHHETAWSVAIPIPAGFVYAYDAYIDPAYRNTGVWLRFKAHLSEWMIASGKRGVLTFVEDGNLPSMKTHLRFGFRPAQTVLAMKVAGLNFSWRVGVIHPRGAPADCRPSSMRAEDASTTL